MKNKLCIVDLDGTLITCNSFHKWIRFIWLKLACEEFSVCAYFRMLIIWVSLLRKFRFIGHSNFKKRIQEIWWHAFSSARRNELSQLFSAQLHQYLRPSLVVELNKQREKGGVLIMATAAPSEYAVLFSDSLKVFSKCIATPYGSSSDWIDNIRSQKRESVQDLISNFDNDVQHVLVYTDHPDDLPLIQLATQAILFSPLSRMRPLLQQRLPEVQFSEHGH